MNEAEQWAAQRNEDCARMEGIIAAYDAVKDRLNAADREALLELAKEALSGKWREKEPQP